MDQKNNNIEEVAVVAQVIDEQSGNLVLKLSNCQFPDPGDKLMLRIRGTDNNIYISEYIVNRRSMIVDAVAGTMCWNIYATMYGKPYQQNNEVPIDTVIKQITKKNLVN